MGVTDREYKLTISQIDELNNILKSSREWTQIKYEDLPEGEGSEETIY